MKEYHKIQTVFKRDPKTHHKTLIEGDFSLPVFEYLKNNTWIFTEKVDGTNIRVMFDGQQITFGGKTDNASIPSFLANRLNEIFLSQFETFKQMFDGPVCLYGEGYGAKIQKGGGLYRPDQDFVLFDVLIGDFWLERESVRDIASHLGIKAVPTIGSGTLIDMVEFARTGFNSKWGPFIAEGIVARPLVEIRDRAGQRVITKIKYRDFFLREVTPK